jgi:uncharacterized protein YndB with AHSA1/START domain
MSRAISAITIERTYKAALRDVWALWTTRKGFESWWGPGGFSAKVTRIDLRPGGELHYEMTAVAAEQIAFMKNAGMPLTTLAKITFVEIAPMERLIYSHTADFIPGVKAYQVLTKVDFSVSGGDVRMVVTLDPMHDEEWTRRAVMGMTSQIDKLDRILASSGGK